MAAIARSCSAREVRNRPPDVKLVATQSEPDRDLVGLSCFPPVMGQYDGLLTRHPLESDQIEVHALWVSSVLLRTRNRCSAWEKNLETSGTRTES